MSSLKPQWVQFVAAIAALTLRERGMILAACLTLMFFTWHIVVASPLARSKHQLEMSLRNADAQLSALRGTVEQLSVANQDPNIHLRERLASAQLELEQLSGRQKAVAQSFISPNLMSGILQELLQSSEGLRLLSLETLPVATLNADSVTHTPPDKGAEVYRHTLRIKLQGSYFDALGYLRQLERQPLFWDSIDYRVIGHPRAEITLEVFTLSFQPEWLGV